MVCTAIQHSTVLCSHCVITETGKHLFFHGIAILQCKYFNKLIVTPMHCGPKLKIGVSLLLLAALLISILVVDSWRRTRENKEKWLATLQLPWDMSEDEQSVLPTATVTKDDPYKQYRVHNQPYGHLLLNTKFSNFIDYPYAEPADVQTAVCLGILSSVLSAAPDAREKFAEDTLSKPSQEKLQFIEGVCPKKQAVLEQHVLMSKGAEMFQQSVQRLRSGQTTLAELPALLNSVAEALRVAAVRGKYQMYHKYLKYSNKDAANSGAPTDNSSLKEAEADVDGLLALFTGSRFTRLHADLITSWLKLNTFRFTAYGKLRKSSSSYRGSDCCGFQAMLTDESLSPPRTVALLPAPLPVCDAVPAQA